VTFYPGAILGGKIYHECPTSRAIGYFLEPVLALAPFAKVPVDATFTGITNDNIDPSVDIIRTCMLPQFAKFGVEDGIELKAFV
jgi:RNA 3'-terminal phosphate cyclase-like protein